jgi:hypothetical protein
MTRRRFALPLLLSAGLLVLGACSSTAASSDDDGGVATLGNAGSAAPSASADVLKEVTTWVECLRGEGVDLPDPTVDENGQVTFGRLQAAGKNPKIDRDKMDAARKVCGDPPPGVMSAAQNTIDDPAFQDAALKFARCMREQGVDVPDPDFSAAGGAQGGMFGKINRDDPKVAAAIKACQHVWTSAGVGPGAGD